MSRAQYAPPLKSDDTHRRSGKTPFPVGKRKQNAQYTDARIHLFSFNKFAAAPTEMINSADKILMQVSKKS